MKTEIENNVTKGLVKNMRIIRDQMNNEIENMTFEQERAYLDRLLSEGKKDLSKKYPINITINKP